jgi:hypothetical protein
MLAAYPRALPFPPLDGGHNFCREQTFPLLLSIGAAAQTQPGRIPPIGVNSEPRFKLEALRFHAINETGNQ